jgi:hypothetical protein
MTGCDQLVGNTAAGGFELSLRELAVLFLPFGDCAYPVSDQKSPTSGCCHPRGNADALVGSRREDTLVDFGVDGDGELW